MKNRTQGPRHIKNITKEIVQRKTEQTYATAGICHSR